MKIKQRTKLESIHRPVGKVCNHKYVEWVQNKTHLRDNAKTVARCQTLDNGM